MSSLKDNALKAAVLKALGDEIGEESKTARAATTQALIDAKDSLGLKSVTVALPDGGPQVATVTLTEPKDSIAVDEAAFVGWVAREHPDELIAKVRDSYRAAILGRLTYAGGVVVDKTSGEVIPWASFVPAPKPSTFRLLFTTGGREAIAEAWRAGRLREVAPGPQAAEVTT